MFDVLKFLSLFFALFYVNFAHGQANWKGDMISLRGTTIPSTCWPGQIRKNTSDSTIQACSAGSVFDQVVLRTTAQTLTNKTIAAGSNTISGITSAMLSSGAASNGTVLTADGSGGTSWATVSATGAFRAVGITGNNNSGTPNTQFDLDADAVELRNSSDVVVIRWNPASETNNISTAGSTANGRDQAGAFTNSTFVHFYWIWNGTDLDTLSSATAPPTGPTLPTGYTHWAYAGAVYLNGSGNLVRTYLKGSWAYYQGYQNASTSSTTGSEVTVSLTGLVPTNALAYKLMWAGTATSSGGADLSYALDVRLVTGVNTFYQYTSFEGQSASAGGQSLLATAEIEMPYIGTSFLYVLTQNAGSSPSLTMSIRAYQLPNGGE